MLQPGTVIGGRFQVIRLLGQGGMSNIYVCQDTHLRGKVWAVKEFTARYSNAQEQQTALSYFKREADLLSSLSHPNLPTINDYFLHQGLYYIAMEFVQGEDLGKILEHNPGPHSEKSVAEWAVQVATVLYYLHCQKPNPIIFRDIKPSNIIINNGQVKLIDFGIARHFAPEKKGDTMRIGSPGYAPPEQYNGQSDPRSDIYALGATMHQALTGIDPTTSKTPFVFKPVREANPQVSEAMADIVAKALKVVPEERYQSMLEMKRELRALLQPQLAMTRPASAQPSLANASKDLLNASAPPPIAVPTPAGTPPIPAGPPPTPATTAPPAPPTGAQAKQKNTGNKTPAAVAPQKRWGCVKTAIIVVLLLAVAIFFGPALLNSVIAVRAKYLHLDPSISRQRIMRSPYIRNVLAFPAPLPCDSPGGKLFINGASPADCFKALGSEAFTPQQLIYKQDVILLQKARKLQTIQAAGLDPDIVRDKVDMPLNLDSVDIALLIPAPAGKSEDMGGQCLIGAAVAQQYLSDWANANSKVKVLLPVTYTNDTLPSVLAGLGDTDIRRTISCYSYDVTRYRPNFAMVFYQSQADNDSMLNAIVSASANCPVPIYAVGLGNGAFRFTSVQQGKAGASQSYALPKLGPNELRVDLPQSLPSTAPKQTVKAQVAVSPFHPHTIGVQAYEIYRRLLGKRAGYGLWPQAFDALCLALCQDQAFQGLQASFSPDGKAQPVPASIYELQGKTWLHTGAQRPQTIPPAASPAASDSETTTANIERTTSAPETKTHESNATDVDSTATPAPETTDSGAPPTNAPDSKEIR